MTARADLPTVLGVDAGSHGVRVVVRAGGDAVATASRDYAGVLPPARRDLAEIVDCLAAVLGELPVGVLARVDGVCITGVRGAVAGFDGAKSVTPVYPDFDAEAVPRARELARSVGPDAVARTGCPAFPLSGLPKLIDRQSEARIWTGLPDAVAAALTGRVALSRGTALRLGVLSADAEGMDPAWLADVGLNIDRLAPLVEIGDVLGMLTPAGAATIGLPEGIPVIVGPGDGAAALAAAAERTGPGVALVGLGTTTVVNAGAAAGIERRLEPDMTYEWIGRALPVGPRAVETGDGSGMFQVDWVSALLRCRPDELDALAAGCDDDDRVALDLPFMDVWGAGRPGSVHGLTRGSGPGALAYSVLALVADGALVALDRVRRHVTVDRVLLAGGGAGSALIRTRIDAAVPDLRVDALLGAQLAAEGAALVAFVALTHGGVMA